MIENPSVDRYLVDKAMDRIDHALGRPIWPLRETSRNYFATQAGSTLAKALDASEHWMLGATSGKMAYYHVTEAGCRALVEHLATLRTKHRAYEVTFEGTTSIIPALTARDARRRLHNRISNYWSELTFATFCRDATVRRAA